MKFNVIIIFFFSTLCMIQEVHFQTKYVLVPMPYYPEKHQNINALFKQEKVFVFL